MANASHTEFDLGGPSMIRLANAKKAAQVAVLTTGLTAVGWGVGCAIAQADPHPHLHLFHPHATQPDRAPGNDAASPDAPRGNPILDELPLKGIVFFKNGIPIGSIKPGQDNVRDIIPIITTCRPHPGNTVRTHDGFIFIHC
jgi:hypothetical protein